MDNSSSMLLQVLIRHAPDNAAAQKCNEWAETLEHEVEAAEDVELTLAQALVDGLMEDIWPWSDPQIRQAMWADRAESAERRQRHESMMRELGVDS